MKNSCIGPMYLLSLFICHLSVLWMVMSTRRMEVCTGPPLESPLYLWRPLLDLARVTAVATLFPHSGNTPGVNYNLIRFLQYGLTVYDLELWTRELLKYLPAAVSLTYLHQLWPVILCINVSKGHSVFRSLHWVSLLETKFMHLSHIYDLYFLP